MTRDLGVSLSNDRVELVHPWAQIALVANAFGMPAVVTVFVDIMDKQGLVHDSKMAKQLDVKGKFLIHPSQI